MDHSDQNSKNGMPHDSHRRAVMKRALYAAPKLIVLGSMIKTVNAGASVLGYPPNPPANTQRWGGGNP